MSHALLLAAVFCGGLLTILSPCILPVLPFVLPRAGRPFWRETAPMLGGLSSAFVAVALAGTVGAAWAPRAAETGRWAALVVLALSAASLLSPRVAAAVSAPAVRAGARLGRGSDASIAGALAVGVATGLLWAPCAGPILGLVVASAVAGADAARSAVLFATFALGAATSLAGVLLAGGRLRAALGTGMAAEPWLRRALGTLALAGVAVIALGWDARLLAGAEPVRTTGAEAALLRRLAPGATRQTATPVPTPDEGPLPELAGATGWLNSAPLTREALRGKVVVVNVWTFACYNCLNALPHVKALAARYRDRGVVVVGVHTPELPRERLRANVEDAVRRLGVDYPVALDDDYAIWRAFSNEYWPSVYIADRRGRIRFHHFGEGRYADEERVVQQLLAEPAEPGARSASR